MGSGLAGEEVGVIVDHGEQVPFAVCVDVSGGCGGEAAIGRDGQCTATRMDDRCVGASPESRKCSIVGTQVRGAVKGALREGKIGKESSVDLRAR